MAEKMFLTPIETAKALVGVGEKKAQLPILKMLVLGILAGVYIGFAAHLATTISTGDYAFGIKKFLTGAVFACGLMLVIIPGSELWTGNNLMSVALLENKINIAQLLKNWFFVYLGNFLGSLLLALIIANSGLASNAEVGLTACSIAAGKCSLPFLSALCRGIGCNWLVCLAVVMALAAQDIGGKVWGIFFPIMAFVASGYEHSIANMYFISAGIFNKMDVINVLVAAGKPIPPSFEALNWYNFLITNLVPVTLGNFIGGSLFVGGIYWYTFVKEDK
ncbi:MAG: formate/nitrite transporter family protein [Candidatus Coatesbacteria bacterium]|nr:formate/nitrite transporter family protein [Candidatus Coatesbacteria bacterium]